MRSTDHRREPSPFRHRSMWQHDWHTSPQEDRPELRNFSRLSKLGGPSQVASLHPDKMPHGHVRRVWTVAEPELQLLVQIEQAGARNLLEIAFGQGEIAAFLILYCRRNKIPLPRNADKFLEIDNGSLSLVITK